MVIGYPEGTDVEQELAVEMSSSEPVDVDDVDHVEDDWEVVEEDESLKSVQVDFKEVDREGFSIQPPSIDDSIMSKSEDSLVTKPAADVAPQTQGNSKDASLDCEDSTLGTDTSEVDKSVTVKQVKTITTKQKKTDNPYVQTTNNN